MKLEYTYIEIISQFSSLFLSLSYAFFDQSDMTHGTSFTNKEPEYNKRAANVPFNGHISPCYIPVSRLKFRHSWSNFVVVDLLAVGKETFWCQILYPTEIWECPFCAWVISNAWITTQSLEQIVFLVVPRRQQLTHLKTRAPKERRTTGAAGKRLHHG